MSREEELITCEYCGIQHWPFIPMTGDPPHQCDTYTLFDTIRSYKKVASASVEFMMRLQQEVAQLRQERDELAAALRFASRYIKAHCGDSVGNPKTDPVAILREHDERVTAEKDREIADLKQSDAALQQTIHSMSAEIQGWHNRLAAIEKRNREQLAASQLRVKELRAVRDKLARFVIRYARDSFAGDWGCIECYPNSDMLIDGFRCAYHLALALESEREQQEAAPDANSDLPAAQTIEEQVNEKSEVILFAARKLRYLAAEFECAPQHQPTDIQSRLKGIALWLESYCYETKEAAPDAQEDPKREYRQ